jgi:hypothetical protein
MDGGFFEVSSFGISQWLFLKSLAFIYFLAFTSLFVQIPGLYGSQGIEPIQDFLIELKRRRKKIPFQDFPSLFWLNAHDYALEGAAGAGILFSIFILIGIGPAWLLFLLLWMIYLSFVSVGSVFLLFQWDILLLEIGFIAIFFSAQSVPSFLYLFLLWFLLFRFMFFSGLVKVLASTPEWRQLKAMRYHFETQPLPTKLAYYLHPLPLFFSKILVILTLLIELGLPILIFSPSEVRFIVFLVFVFFQILIFFTGNYAFFNLLTIVLCIPLLDDSYWMQLGIHFSWASGTPWIIDRLLDIMAVILICLNGIQFMIRWIPLQLFDQLLSFCRSYYLVNSYGLFANMTTRRFEIIIEGSLDGINWKPYEFKWKPGSLTEAPKQVAPHQPRLDWQMWFAALSSYYSNPWFIKFLIRLLEGSPTVLRLLKTNPFEQKPPKLIRALLYDYHFSDITQKRKTGEWWTRIVKGTYFPAISLQKHSNQDHSVE